MRITDTEFVQLSNYIRQNFGINITKKKRTLLISRLNKVLEEQQFNSFSEYYNYLLTDRTGKAVTGLIDNITTNHTYFYREKQHYNFLTKEVLPYLITKKRNERDLRIWSAGCSSGEEPYTLAMVLTEFLGKNKVLWDTKILATDISSNVLTKAKKAIYTRDAIKDVPLLWKQKYFTPLNGNKFKLNESIKNEVIFRRLNLLSPFNFKKRFDIIFCRNVMIYFDSDTTCQLVKKFYDITESGGYLFISHSESLDRSNTSYKYVKPSIYRKE